MKDESENPPDQFATRPHRKLGPKLSTFALCVAGSLLGLSGCGSNSANDAADAGASDVSQQSGSADDSGIGTTVPTLSTSVDSSLAMQPTPESTSAPSSAPQPTSPTPSTSVGGGGSQDPCRLISPAEAEAALGMPVQEAVVTEFDSQTYGHGSDCSYSTVDQAAGPTTVHVGVLGEGFPRDLWEQSERAESGMQEVEGLGDIAFFDETNGKIDAYVGGRWVQAQMINTNESELLADLTEIVRTAIERI